MSLTKFEVLRNCSVLINSRTDKYIMIDSHKGILYSKNNEWSISIPSNIGWSHNHNAEQQQTDTKGCIWKNPSLVKFKVKHSLCTVRSRGRSCTCDAASGLCLDLGASYLSIFTLWKLIKLNSYDLNTYTVYDSSVKNILSKQRIKSPLGEKDTEDLSQPWHWL
jgi:hypothetical protein